MNLWSAPHACLYQTRIPLWSRDGMWLSQDCSSISAAAFIIPGSWVLGRSGMSHYIWLRSTGWALRVHEFEFSRKRVFGILWIVCIASRSATTSDLLGKNFCRARDIIFSISTSEREMQVLWPARCAKYFRYTQMRFGGPRDGNLCCEIERRKATTSNHYELFW